MAHLRLAIVTPRFWPLVGDVPTHLLRLADSLLGLGHHATVVTALWRRTWPERMTLGRVPLVRLSGSPRGGWSTLRWMYSLSRWLGETGSRLDGVLVAGMKHEAYVALSAMQRTGAATVLLAGDGDLAWHGSAMFGGRIADRCGEARAIVAPTPALADELARAVVDSARICVIPRRVNAGPGRSAKLRDEARAALAAANYDLATTANSIVALAVGRLEAEQRFGDLVRAWRIVTARRPETRLWIVGDGPERERLYRQIGDLDQRYRAFLPGTFDSLDEVLQAGDMLLTPAVKCVPSLALLEAQAASLPVVAAASSDARPLLESEGTSYYPAGDIKSLAAEILRVMEKPRFLADGGQAASRGAMDDRDCGAEAAQYVALFEQLRGAG